MLKDFKEFAMKGNVVDLAVGFILGGAFSTIVKSLVNDVIMPPVGLMLGDVDFAEMKWVLQSANAATEQTEVAISYGLFVSSIISFIIIALVLFFMIKGMNNAQKNLEKQEEEAAAAAEPPRHEQLLEEIRDLLSSTSTKAKK